MPIMTIFQDSGMFDWRVVDGYLRRGNPEVLPLSDIPEFIEWLQSEYAKHNPEAKEEDDGEWIEWEGGKCPVDGIVDVKWRSGAVSPKNWASGLCWSHQSSIGDIVAYRLSQ